MSRTNDLRNVIQSILKTVCENTYFEVASTSAMYPHIVYSYSDINSDSGSRHDMTVEIDIWDKGTDSAVIENLADRVEDLFNGVNDPQTNILPTFFLIDRKSIPDEDKKIKHRLVRVLVQNYER